MTLLKWREINWITRGGQTTAQGPLAEFKEILLIESHKTAVIFPSLVFQSHFNKEINTHFVEYQIIKLSAVALPTRVMSQFSLLLLSYMQAVKQNPSSGSGGSDKATPSRSGPVKKESIGAQYRHHPLRARRRPPKGMHLEQADITALSASQDSGVVTIRQLDIQLVSLKRQVLVPALQVRLDRSRCSEQQN